MGADTDAPEIKLVDVDGKSTTEILSQIDLFEGLPRPHLQRVADLGAEETYRTNEKVFEEGDGGDKFYLILEGAIRISRFVPGMGEEALAVVRSRSGTNASAASSGAPARTPASTSSDSANP